MLFLSGVTFNLYAEDVCGTYKLKERSKSFFPYSIDINQAKLDEQIEFQVGLAHHLTCKKDNTSYKQIEILTKYKNETEVQKKATADPDKIKEFDKTLSNVNEQLSTFEKKRDALDSKLTKACKIPTSVNPILNKELPLCITSLKQQLEFEIKQYPFKNPIPEGADAAKKKEIDDLNKSNEYKYELAKSDLSMLESLSGNKNELEKSPSSIGILKTHIRESEYLGADTNILLDILDTKSADIAIFRQKIKVLERNSRVLISELDFSPNCELYNTNPGLIGKLGEPIKTQRNALKDYETKACRLATNLSYKLNKTLQLSYKDSWFENQNIEDDIKDIEKLLEELYIIEKSNEILPVKRLNYLNHANQYFAKYNGTGRFNIGLGVALFNAPDINNTIDFTLDLSQFTAGNIDSQNILDDLNTPSGKKLSPIIVATMPWVDATLTFPEYSKNSTYTSPINAWELPLEDEQTQHGFLSQTTIESSYKIDYDINIALKIFSWLQDICPYYCYRLNNATRDKNIEFALGLGTTDIQLTKTLTTDIREQIDLNGGYSQLASLHQLESEETIDHSMQYWYVGGHYYMADQIRLEAYWKRYKSDYKDGDIKLTSKSSWGVSIAYLFF
jgi:hypothetical protein